LNMSVYLCDDKIIHPFRKFYFSGKSTFSVLIQTTLQILEFYRTISFQRCVRLQGKFIMLHFPTLRHLNFAGWKQFLMLSMLKVTAGTHSFLI